MGRGGGGEEEGGWLNPLKKKIRHENPFKENMELISKNLWKMIPADVKANKSNKK